jgi:hypothetical protein
VSGLFCRERKPDGQRAFPAAALLGGKDDRMHSTEILRIIYGATRIRQTAEPFSLWTFRPDPKQRDRGGPNHYD